MSKSDEFLKATQAEIWAAILGDDGETVLQLSTEEWSDPATEAEGMTHLEYLDLQIDCLKDDGIRDSDDAMALAFYMLAKEALIKAHEGSE